MYLKEEILKRAEQALTSPWSIKEGSTIPCMGDVNSDSDAISVDVAMLCACCKKSMSMAYDIDPRIVAKYCKAFLCSVCDVLSNNNGSVVSWSTTTIMAAFVGNRKCSDAAKAALQIHNVVRGMNDLIASIGMSSFRFCHAVGIDVGKMFVVKSGMRNVGKLLWVGDAFNNAEKLGAIECLSGPTFITRRLFEKLNDNSKYKNGATKERLMWNETNERVNGQAIMQSDYWWLF